MALKLITPSTLEKLRRGAEHLYTKHCDRLTDATVVIRRDIAKDLGFAVKDVTASPVPADSSQKVGIFDDEPATATVIPVAMMNVLLVEYIEALKAYDATPSASKLTSDTAGKKDAK